MQLPRDLDGQPGLADPAGTEQRDQPHVGVPQQIGHLGELDGPAEERRRRSRDHGHAIGESTRRRRLANRGSPGLAANERVLSRRDANVILRVIGAAAALVGGYAHLSLYNDGYKDIPVGNIGEQFLANALGAVAIALGLVVPLFVRQLPDLVWKLAAVGGCGVGGDLARRVVLRQADR